MIINVELKKKQTTMKQTYINPELKVVKLQTQQMLAVSIQMYGANATGAGMSREFDYDDEEEYEEY